MLYQHSESTHMNIFLVFVSTQISAEEVKDNRVVMFEIEARKLDNKVLNSMCFHDKQ